MCDVSIKEMSESIMLLTTRLTFEIQAYMVIIYKYVRNPLKIND